MRNVCEADFCDSTEILQIHHPNSKNAGVIRKEVWDHVYNQFNTWYKSVYPTKDDIKKYSMTSRGGTRNKPMHRHDGYWNWHYITTKHKNGDLHGSARTIQDMWNYTAEYKEFDHNRWTEKFEEYKRNHHDNIQDIINILIDEENKKYMEFEDIQVLCNRCHFAHHKGMDLCPVCKKKYKKKQYKTCYDCKPKGL